MRRGEAEKGQDPVTLPEETSTGGGKREIDREGLKERKDQSRAFVYVIWSVYVDTPCVALTVNSEVEFHHFMMGLRFRLAPLSSAATFSEEQCDRVLQLLDECSLG